MPRTFTPQQVRSTTVGDLNAMSQEDQQAYQEALWRLMEEATTAQIARDNRRDAEEGGDYA